MNSLFYYIIIKITIVKIMMVIIHWNNYVVYIFANEALKSVLC